MHAAPLSPEEQYAFVEHESFGVRPWWSPRQSAPSFDTDWISVPGVGGVRVRTPRFDLRDFQADPADDVLARAVTDLETHMAGLQILGAIVCLAMWMAFAILLLLVTRKRYLALRSGQVAPSLIGPPSPARRAVTAFGGCVALGLGWWAARWRLWTPSWPLLFGGITWTAGALMFWAAGTQTLGRLAIGIGAYGVLLIAMAGLPAGAPSVSGMLGLLAFGGMGYAMLLRPLIRYTVQLRPRLHLPSLSEAAQLAPEAQPRLLAIGLAAAMTLAVWSAARAIDALATEPQSLEGGQWKSHQPLELSGTLLSGHVFLAEAILVIGAAAWLLFRQRRLRATAFAILVAAAGTATVPIWRQVLGGQPVGSAYGIAQLLLGPLAFLAIAGTLALTVRDAPGECVPLIDPLPAPLPAEPPIPTPAP